jgi:hypothetical protein
LRERESLRERDQIRKKRGERKVRSPMGEFGSTPLKLRARFWWLEVRTSGKTRGNFWWNSGHFKL